MDITRRDWMAATAAGMTWAGSAIAETQVSRDPSKRGDNMEPFGYCLNTSTLSGQKLSLVEELSIIAEAGYQGVEPWIRQIDEFVKGGGSLRDLGKRIADLGLSIPSVIGFFDWIVDDERRRRKGLEEASRNFEIVRAIGGKKLAAPPAGATDQTHLDLRRAADRYRALLELGERFEVTAELEFWGHSKCLGTLAEAVYVALESGRADACILADVFHLYKGGSNPNGLRLLAGSAIGVFHFNDYPDQPPRAEINDSLRVYPGDGVAPLNQILRDLQANGYRGMLSLELFNREYWRQDARRVAKTGLEKMRAAVRAALGR